MLEILSVYALLLALAVGLERLAVRAALRLDALVEGASARIGPGRVESWDGSSHGAVGSLSCFALGLGRGHGRYSSG